MLHPYCNQPVDVIERTLDKWGAVEKETKRRIFARIEYGNKVVTDQNGQRSVSTVRILVPNTTQRPKLSDFVEIDDVKHQVIEVRSAQDFQVRGWEINLA